jgi:hypothetical protein
MRERNISEDEVAHTLKFGTTIESYPDDTPYPSELILCWCGDRPIHVVVSTIEVDSVMFICTAYEPDKKRWKDNFKRRKK